MEEVAIGIDAGTSNSVIGVYKNYHVEIVPNSIGDTHTPSIVDILDEGEYVGEETMLHKIDENNSKNRIMEIKRIIGRKFSSLSDQEIEKYNTIEDPKNKNQILIKVKRMEKEELLSPEDIMSFIIKKLVKIASNFIGKAIKRAVLTFPAYFDYNQRGAIVESSKKAGLEILRILNEPTAAALAYGLGTSNNLKDSLAVSMILQDKKNFRKVIVFDLGGGTFDVSILTIKDNKDFHVVATSGDAHLGGDDFDNKLVDFCINKFCSVSNVSETEIRKNKNILRRLKIQCEKAKKKLSSSDTTTINIYNLFMDNNLFVEITIEEFDSICADLYNRIKITLDKVIIDSKFSIEEIDDLVVVGGASRITKIKTILKEKFGEKKIRDEINPDEAVAIGATWQAHKIIKSNIDINIIDITPFTLGIASKSHDPKEKEKGSVMSVLIPKNKEIPCRSEVKKYKTVQDNQKFFKVQLFAGENKYCKYNDLLKEFKIENLPEGKAGTVYLQLSLEINKDGILYINAEVESIGKKITEKFSLYEKANTLNDSKKNKKVKLKGKEKLDTIKELTNIMKEKKQLLEESNDDNKKFICLKDLSGICSKLIETYSALSEQNDSETLYQKLFHYYEKILKYYSEMIIISKDDKIIEDITNKIKDILSKLINDDIENMINILSPLKEKKPENYIYIILFCTDLLYKEGEKILNEGKNFARYYARKYFVKAEKIKSFIDEDLNIYMNIELRQLKNEIESKFDNKVGEIDSFVRALKSQIKSKNTPYISGFTFVRNVIQKAMEPENIEIALDIFNEMVATLSQEKNNLNESEAYCLVNIIKIKFSVLLNQSLNDLNIYQNLMDRIDFLIDRLDLNETIFWVEQYNELKEEIEEKKEKLSQLGEDKLKEIKKAIEDMNKLYNIKIREEKKPMEFINFIIKKYPFISYDKNKDLLNNINYEKIFEIIFPKYHPDNYSKKEDFLIYNEIYILLNKMKEDLIK